MSEATGFVLPDHLTRVQGLRQLQIGDVLNWIALPQIVLVPLVAVLLRWVQARLILAFGFSLLAVGTWRPARCVLHAGGAAHGPLVAAMGLPVVRQAPSHRLSSRAKLF